MKAKYKLLTRWYVSDGDEETADTGWKVIGTFRRIRKAREAMHKAVKETEAANMYQDPDYGGLDDTQTSTRIGRDEHVYDLADSNGSLVHWEIVPIGKGFTRPIWEL